jgi:hypothetical protein
MTRKDKGGFGKKRPSGIELNPAIAEAAKQEASDGKITCAAAFRVAEKLKAPPGEVGIAVDLLEMPIIKCQLGLFGYGSSDKEVKAAEAVSQALEAAIKEFLVSGKLPCASAWAIAEKLRKPKREIASACEALKIKIGPCQLGAF